MLTAIAIDDEAPALEVLRLLAAKVPFLDLRATFTDALAASEWLQSNSVDMVFLDIQMPDISGLEWAKSLVARPLLVFATAYPEHALASYELDAVDYLLKPFSLARLLKACQKAHELVQLRQAKSLEPVNDTPANSAAHQSIFVKTGYEQVKIRYDDILWVESAGNYLVFVLATGKVISRLTMAEGLALLPPERFVRIHRSYIAAVDKVERVERHQVHIGQQAIPLGAAYAEALNKLL